MRPIDVVRRVAPRANIAYLQAFERGDVLFANAGITTPLRLAHFLAQVMHESGGLTIFQENLNYTAQRMTEVWPSRFRSAAEAAPYAHNPRALANKVYNGRMGNVVGSDDGWNYRGRGLMQTTGRYNYRKMGELCGVDFEGHPDLIFSADHALKPALGEWMKGGLNTAADRNDIRTITHVINGGYTGLSEREAWLRKIRPLIDKVDLLAVPPGQPAQPAQPAPPVEPPPREPMPPLPPPPPGPSGPIHTGVFATIAAAVGAAAKWLADFDWSTVGGFVAIVAMLGITTWLIRRKIK